MYTTKIGHIHIKVRNLQRSVEFYSSLLNFSVKEILGNHYAFLSGGEMHHELALQNVGSNALTTFPNSIGLFHVAFEVPDKHSLAKAYLRLKERNLEIIAVNHRISWAMYFSDPDGNGVEIYWDSRKEEGTNNWTGYSVHLDMEKICSECEADA
jgi:catechol 2,3-dioxygenase